MSQMPHVMILDDVAARLRASSIKNFDALFLLGMVESLLKEVRDWSCLACEKVVSGGRTGKVPAGGYQCPCGGYRAPAMWAENYRLAADNTILVQEVAARVTQVEALEQQLKEFSQSFKGGPIGA